MAFSDLLNTLANAKKAQQDEYRPTTVDVGYQPPVQDVPNPVPDVISPPSGNRSKGMTHEKLNEIDSSMQSGTDSRDIAKLLADYDAASKSANQNKAFNQFTRAGMTMGHALGGERPDEAFLKGSNDIAEQPVNDLLTKQKLKYGVEDQSRKNRTVDLNNQKTAIGMDETGQDITKKELGNDNETNLQNPSSNASQIARDTAKKAGYNVPDGASAKDILDTMPLLKADMDMIEKAAHEKASDERTNRIIGAQNQRGKENNATEVLKKELDAASKDGQMNGRQADVMQRASERMVPGFKWKGLEQGMMPTLKDANSATELTGRFNTVVGLGMKVVNTLQNSPHNVPLTTTWNQLKTDIADIIETRTKLKGDGVMNGKDWDHAIRAIGDPNSFAQWVNHGGLTQMQRMLVNAKQEYNARMDGFKYTPGDMSMDDIKRLAPGSAGVQSGGNTLQPSQDSIDAIYPQTGIGGRVPKFGSKASPQKNEAPTADGLRAKLQALRGN